MGQKAPWRCQAAGPAFERTMRALSAKNSSMFGVSVAHGGIHHPPVSQIDLLMSRPARGLAKLQQRI